MSTNDNTPGNPPSKRPGRRRAGWRIQRRRARATTRRVRAINQAYSGQEHHSTDSTPEPLSYPQPDPTQAPNHGFSAPLGPHFDLRPPSPVQIPQEDPNSYYSRESPTYYHYSQGNTNFYYPQEIPDAYCSFLIVPDDLPDYSPNPQPTYLYQISSELASYHLPPSTVQIEELDQFSPEPENSYENLSDTETIVLSDGDE